RHRAGNSRFPFYPRARPNRRAFPAISCPSDRGARRVLPATELSPRSPLTRLDEEASNGRGTQEGCTGSVLLPHRAAIEQSRYDRIELPKPRLDGDPQKLHPGGAVEPPQIAREPPPRADRLWHPCEAVRVWPRTLHAQAWRCWDRLRIRKAD